MDQGEDGFSMDFPMDFPFGRKEVLLHFILLLLVILKMDTSSDIFHLGHVIGNIYIGSQKIFRNHRD